MAHKVYLNLGTQNVFTELYLWSNWHEWRKMDSIHTLINHRSYLDTETPWIKEFDEFNILNYTRGYGEMCRDVLERIKDFETKFYD